MTSLVELNDETAHLHKTTFLLSKQINSAAMKRFVFDDFVFQFQKPESSLQKPKV